MRNTPFFPALHATLAPMGSRTAQTIRQVRDFTLCQLEACFGPWIPTTLFPKAPEKENSRDRHYTRWRTFWCMIWQALNPETSGREVVRQLQALFSLEDGPSLSEEDGAYCRAKARLPLSGFSDALPATAKAADGQGAGAGPAGRPAPQGHRRLRPHPGGYPKKPKKISSPAVPRDPELPHDANRGVVLPAQRRRYSGGSGQLGCLRTGFVGLPAQPIDLGRYPLGRPWFWQLPPHRPAQIHAGCGFHQIGRA